MYIVLSFVFWWIKICEISWDDKYELYYLLFIVDGNYFYKRI